MTDGLCGQSLPMTVSTTQRHLISLYHCGVPSKAYGPCHSTGAQLLSAKQMKAYLVWRADFWGTGLIGSTEKNYCYLKTGLACALSCWDVVHRPL
jgi:hypothetical protein